MPYAPVFEILATKGTQGRYYQRTYAVTIKDILVIHKAEVINKSIGQEKKWRSSGFYLLVSRFC
jgi:hypothetical protein